MGVSIAGASALNRILGWPIPITVPAVAVAVGFSVATGILFGFLPARRAARRGD